MSEYQVGTVLEDKDGERLTVHNDGKASYSGGQPMKMEYIESYWGPLKVVEEPATVSRFAGLNALAEALTKPWPPGWEGCDPMRCETEDNHSEDTDLGFVVPQKVLDKAQSASGDDFPDDVLAVYSEAFNILLRKNADYGPSNIADSPGGPLNGILVRMWDKMSRLRHLVESGATPENESLRDTLMDMANYSLIAMIVLDGNWPGMEGDS